MDVVLVAQISVGDVHVLASVNVEVLSLLVLDLKQVSLHVLLVLAEEGTDNWVVVLGRLQHQQALQHERHAEPLEESPAESRGAAVVELGDSLEGEPSTEEPGDAVVSRMGVVEVRKSLSILEWEVVGKEINLLVVAVLEGVEPLESIILYPELSEPRSS